MNTQTTANQPEQAATVDPRAPGAPWMSSYLTVQDADRAIRFYEDALGFTLMDSTRDSDGKVLHAEMRFHDQLIMFAPEGAFGGTTKAPVTMSLASPVTFYIYVDDVDVAFQHAIQYGAKASQEPTNAFWGDRYAMVTDPDGYAWSLAKNIGEFDPTKLPANVTNSSS